MFSSEEELIRVQERLAGLEVFARRYFYPSVNTYTDIVDYQPAPISEDISRRILCLPLYRELSEESIGMIVEAVAGALR